MSGLGSIAAIKRLKGQHSARFEQEARSIAALNHPHICQIHKPLRASPRWPKLAKMMNLPGTAR